MAEVSQQAVNPIDQFGGVEQFVGALSSINALIKEPGSDLCAYIITPVGRPQDLEEAFIEVGDNEIVVRSMGNQLLLELTKNNEQFIGTFDRGLRAKAAARIYVASMIERARPHVSEFQQRRLDALTTNQERR